MLSFKILSIIFIFLSLNVQAIIFNPSLDTPVNLREHRNKYLHYETKLRSTYDGKPDYKMYTKLQWGDATFDAAVTLDSPVTVLSYANLTSPGPSNLLVPNGYFDVNSLESYDYVIYQEYLKNAPGCNNFPNQCTLVNADKDPIKLLNPTPGKPNISDIRKVFFALPTTNNNLQNLLKSEKKLNDGLPTYDQVTQSSDKMDPLSMFSKVNGSSNGNSKFSSVEGLKDIGLDFSNIPSTVGLGGDIIVDSTQEHYSETGDMLHIVFSDKVKGVTEFNKDRFLSEVSGSVAIFGYFSGISNYIAIRSLPMNSKGKRITDTPQGKFIMAGPIQKKNDSKKPTNNIYKLDINTSTLKLPRYQYQKFMKKFKTTDCKTQKKYYISIGGEAFEFLLANLMYEDESNPGKCFMNVEETQDTFTTLGIDTLAYFEMVFKKDMVYLRENGFLNN